MNPFQLAGWPPEVFELDHYLSKGIAPDVARKLIDLALTDWVYRNDTHQVVLRGVPPTDGFPEMYSLSIKRIDKEVIHDWRDLQEIKNMLVGPEHEAVELYPAESRLVDSANQYWLWVLADPTIRFPFGFKERYVVGAEEAELFGSKQRERAR